jgi:hypothetical protein
VPKNVTGSDQDFRERLAPGKGLSQGNHCAAGDERTEALLIENDAHPSPLPYGR